MKVITIIFFIITLTCSTVIGFEKEDSVVFSKKGIYAAFPNVFKADDGTIVLSFVTRSSSSHIDTSGGSKVLVSRDNGKTWSPSKKQYINPLFRSSDGSIIVPVVNGWSETPANKVASLRKQGIQVRENNGKFFSATGVKIRTSLDNGVTWNEKQLSTPTHNILMGYNHSSHIRTVKGLRLMTVYGKINQNEKYQPFIVRSEDDGKNWSFFPMFPRGTPPGIGFGETAIVESKNGEIVAFMRTDPDSKGLFSSISKDGGITWSTPKKTDFWGFPANAIKLNDGRILCSYGYRRSPMGIRAAIVSDNYTSVVGNELVIRKDSAGKPSDTGYPVALQLNNSILIIYYITNNDGITFIASSSINKLGK